MVKHCIYLTCRTNTRRPIPGVTFVPFVKPTHILRCKRWLKLCGKPDLDLEKITRCTYICTKHFPPDVSHDWKENLDLEPYPVNSKIDVQIQIQSKADIKKMKLAKKKASKVLKSSNREVEDIGMEEIGIKSEPLECPQ